MINITDEELKRLMDRLLAAKKALEYAEEEAKNAGKAKKQAYEDFTVAASEILEYYQAAKKGTN